MKHGAELVFTERSHAEGDPGLPGWDGRLLNPQAMDRQTGKPARNYLAAIRYCMPYGSHEGYGEPSPGHEHRYLVTLQGHSKFARRYMRYATLDEAQTALINWARRRFYVEA